jgi:hypothetical protein
MIYQVNLSWKLAWVYHGHASQGLLETYADERIPVIAEMLNMSTNLHYFVFGKPIASTLDGAIGGSVEKKTDVDTETAMQRPKTLLQLGMNYRWSPIVLETREHGDVDVAKDPYGQQTDRLRAGDRAPDAVVSSILKDAGPQDTTLHKFHDLRRHIILVFARSANILSQLKEVLTPIRELFDKDLATLAVVLPQSVDIDTPSHLPHDRLHVLCDKEGGARRAYDLDLAGSEDTYVIVRPDGAIGAVAGNAVSVRRYFDMLRLGGRP